LANPLTSYKILEDVLQEQRDIAKDSRRYVPQMLALIKKSAQTG
jgi:hypothetical protein